MTEPPPVPRRTWVPLACSAAVYPGLGQLLQKRFLAGILYMAIFTGFAGWTFIELLIPQIRNLRIASEGFHQDLVLVDWADALTALGCAAAVYLLNLLDAFKSRDLGSAE